MGGKVASCFYLAYIVGREKGLRRVVKEMEPIREDAKERVTRPLVLTCERKCLEFPLRYQKRARSWLGTPTSSWSYKRIRSLKNTPKSALFEKLIEHGTLIDGLVYGPGETNE